MKTREITLEAARIMDTDLLLILTKCIQLDLTVGAIIGMVDTVILDFTLPTPDT